MRLVAPGRPLGPVDLERCGAAFMGAERVLVATEDDAAMVIASLGVRRAGGTLVPLDPRAAANEVRRELAACDLAVVDPSVRERWPITGRVIEVAPPPPRNVLSRLLGRAPPPVTTFPGCLTGATPSPAIPSERPAVWLRTSGTTGLPKIVPMARSAVDAQLPVLRTALLGSEDAVVLSLLPLHHFDGVVMGTWMVEDWGATLVRLGRFLMQELPTVLDVVVRERVTHLVAPPAVLSMLLRVDEDLREIFGRHFRVFVSTSAPLPSPLWARLEEATGRPVVNVYGLTETGNFAFTPPSLTPGRHGTVGTVRGIETRVVDGELQVRGAMVMRTYEDGSSPLTPDAFYPTGDVVEVGPDGVMSVVGRRRSLISVGGQKIGPAEVEDALLSCPGVQDAWVYGVPDPLWGERPVGQVVGAVDEAAVMTHLRTRLSEHKLPRELIVVEKILRGATGKISARPVEDTASGVLGVAARVFRVPVERLRPSMGPTEVPGWDSVGHLDLISALEAGFGLTLSTREILRIRTLSDAIAVVESRRNA